MSIVKLFISKISGLVEFDSIECFKINSEANAGGITASLVWTYEEASAISSFIGSSHQKLMN